MNQKEIKELIELLVEKDIAEFEMERGDVKLHIKRGDTHAVVRASGCTGGSVSRSWRRLLALRHRWRDGEGAGAVAAVSAADEDANLHIVKSPIVGTFYESASPGAPPFVGVGDSVNRGTGAVHHRSDEADERDRSRRYGRDREAVRQ